MEGAANWLMKKLTQMYEFSVLETLESLRPEFREFRDLEPRVLGVLGEFRVHRNLPAGSFPETGRSLPGEVNGAVFRT